MAAVLPAAGEREAEGRLTQWPPRRALPRLLRPAAPWLRRRCHWRLQRGLGLPIVSRAPRGAWYMHAGYYRVPCTTACLGTDQLLVAVLHTYLGVSMYLQLLVGSLCASCRRTSHTYSHTAIYTAIHTAIQPYSRSITPRGTRKSARPVRSCPRAAAGLRLLPRPSRTAPWHHYRKGSRYLQSCTAGRARRVHGPMFLGCPGTA